jgi:hypothetical protein
MNRIIHLVWFFVFSVAQSQHFMSPARFLGYSAGERFTPHHRIVDYFRHAAEVSSVQRIRLETYGQTHEGRPLLAAIVSAPQNMAKLDQIMANQQRMAGFLRDQPADLSLPAVVWLSYNVHGNEPSSSEVSMELLYRMLSNTDTALQRWLNQVVVVIDPCLNPDGRDRYVQWYNQTRGLKPDANPFAREHAEPWPGGRTNHYYFDLNRDWAWQTQPESRFRVKLYQSWMPVVHVDFHEQYPANPYYFAPAAEPMHEAITPWQRGFQHAVGKNHARYFDQNGWLYFTREVFDLFYPAYGDTYPMFNGSVGMTYEQAGHSVGGLSILVDADTLTLAQRIAHHLTTSLSTIEVAASNRQALNQAFQQYFSKTLESGSGIYQTYVIKGGQGKRAERLQEILKNNRITFESTKPGQTAKAFSYFTGKEETIRTEEGDWMVTTKQSAGNLVRVLFEPNPMLSDTLTYDITAWALPYAHGIETYAVKSALVAGSSSPKTEQYILADSYGWLIDYRSFEDARVLGQLLLSGIRVRYAEEPFVCRGVRYERGTLIVLAAENQSKRAAFAQLVQQHRINLSLLPSGLMDSGFDLGSDKVHLIKAPRVGLLAGSTFTANAVGEVWHWFDQEVNYPVSLIQPDQLRESALDELDVLIAPNGYDKMLADKDHFLKRWVRAGGKLIAMESAVDALAQGEWGFKLKKAAESEEKAMSISEVKRYADRERSQVSGFTPGAVYPVELDVTHPLALGCASLYPSLKLNDQVIELLRDGWNVGIIREDKPMAGFIGSSAKTKVQEGSVIATMAVGSGTIVLFADNPMFRGFWENGKHLFNNAVFLVN